MKNKKLPGSNPCQGILKLDILTFQMKVCGENWSMSLRIKSLDFQFFSSKIRRNETKRFLFERNGFLKCQINKFEFIYISTPQNRLAGVETLKKDFFPEDGGGSERPSVSGMGSPIFFSFRGSPNPPTRTYSHIRRTADWEGVSAFECNSRMLIFRRDYIFMT